MKEPRKLKIFLGSKQDINLEAPTARSPDLTIPTEKNTSDRKSEIQQALMEFDETVGSPRSPRFAIALTGPDL